MVTEIDTQNRKKNDYNSVLLTNCDCRGLVFQ